MDEFGVLTERYGLKPQGKSAPMSQAKRSTAATITTANRNFDFGFTRNPTSFSSKTSWNSIASNGSLLDDHAFFPKQNSQNSFGCGEDYGYKFGGFENPTTNQSNTSNNSSSNGSSYHLASMLFNSDPRPSSTNSYVIDDVFGETPVSQIANSNDDIGSCPVGDLLGDYSGVAAKLKGSSGNGSWDSGKNEAGVDDLIPGFGGSSTPVNRTNVETTKSTFRSTEEPFVVLESDSGREYNFSEAPTDTKGEFSMFNQSGGTKPHGSSNASQSLRPPPKPANILEADKGSSASLSGNKVKSSGASLIDELEDFAKARVNNEATRSREAEDASEKTQQNRGDDLESFFSGSSRSNSAPKSMATTLDPTFDKNILNRQQNTFAGASSTESKASSVTMTNGSNDLSFISGAASMFGEFEEVEGKSEVRQRSRLGRYQRTQDRMARAVADMNQRDRKTQHEQEERHRIGEAINFEIKRWSAGKEGNMRALLSLLQQVLWSECGWEPVSLTDLITSGSVKKVYRKATLCVHPDKVQQKGATLEQKYIAEKVFDILKEAWNKFNREELS